jgi:putative acetyltransferase
MAASWTARPETAADVPAIREILLAAFPTSQEADLVDALRADAAWLPELALVAKDAAGTAAGYAVFTRCHVDGAPALALGPCAVLPDRQRTGAGTAAIRAGLLHARMRRENVVLVLGDPEYYGRFGFTPASEHGIGPPFEAPDESMMALLLDPLRSVPGGTVAYAPPFSAVT